VVSSFRRRFDRTTYFGGLASPRFSLPACYRPNFPRPCTEVDVTSGGCTPLLGVVAFFFLGTAGGTVGTVAFFGPSLFNHQSFSTRVLVLVSRLIGHSEFHAPGGHSRTGDTGVFAAFNSTIYGSLDFRQRGQYPWFWGLPGGTFSDRKSEFRSARTL